MSVILTIISAIASFCVFYLLGSRRQKEKDEKVMKQYKVDAEAEIRKSKQDTAEAKAVQNRAETEKTILNKTANIIRNPVIREKEPPKKRIEDLPVENLGEALDVLKTDSERRAEEIKKRYEE